MLYLLTFADMRAVGPGVMTGWQAQILWELYRRALAAAHRRPAPSRPRATTWPQRVWPRPCDREGAAHAVTGAPRHALRPLPRDDARPSASPRTCGSSSASRRTSVATELFHHPDLGSSELVIATRDVPGLFSLIAGTPGRPRHQHPLRADPHARRRHRHRHLPGQRSLRRAGHRGGALAPDARGAPPRAPRRGRRWRRCSRARRAGRPARETVPGPPKVSVDNRLSDTHTVVEVKCPDRVGLLYAHHPHAVRARARHRQRADRHRDRPRLRHLLRDRPAGPAASRTRRPWPACAKRWKTRC